jgi:hypothetical protein
MLELYKLGTTPDGDGNFTYDPQANRLLEQRVQGLAFDGRLQFMHPRNFATAAAARAIATVVGGVVVRHPMGSNWVTSIGPERTPFFCLGVALGDIIANAGDICMVLGNDTVFANTRRKSEEICGLLGIPLDVTMADRLYDALV